MTGLLLMLLLPQQAPLQVEMRADADRVPVGGEVVVTVRASSGRAEPIQVQLPPLAGFELIERSERSEVATGPVVIARTTVLELRLRGSTVGKWRIGPARARQGDAAVEADPVQVEVTGQASPATAAAPALSPRVQQLIARSRPPNTSRAASVSILLSTGDAYVGEQVDVVTAAWFPRELRLQLRRPPTVQTPSIDGVYAYPQRAPGGIAASRQVDGRWYDLFIVHQIVFPLTPGTLRVPPATLQYSVPLAFQFFSQEERHAVKSEPGTLEVLPVPARGRPPDYAGAVGHGLTIQRSLDPRSGRAGEPFTMEIELSGSGNVSLWPAPELEWPEHLRAYSERVSDRIDIAEGVLGGTKTFRYLVIPDSARTAGLPALHYTYFDPSRSAFTAASAPAVTYLVSPGAEAVVSRVSPAPLKLTSRPALARRVANRLPGWAVVLLAGLPPLVVLFRFRPRRRPRLHTPAGPRATSVAAAERMLMEAIAELVPDLTVEGARLSAALRAVGVESEIASQTADLLARLRLARYGENPSGPPGALVAEVQALLPRLRGVEQSARVRKSVSAAIPAGVVLVVLTTSGQAWGQGLPPEQLYQRNALVQAEAGFAARAALNPDVPAHWYNLGATRFRMGDAGGALAAWVRAERLAPRDQEIRRALRLVPPAERLSARKLWVPPFTPEELWILGGVLWIVGWLGYALSRGRQRWGVVVLVGLVAGLSGFALHRWYERPLAVVTAARDLALSPHDRAPAVTPLRPSSVVSVVSVTPGWLMVRAPGGQLGWLPRDAVERL